MVRGDTALVAQREAWRALEARAARVSVPFEVLARIASGRPGPRAALVYEDARLVGAWALERRRLGPVRVLRPLGGPFQTYGGPTLAAGVDAGVVAGCAWEALRTGADALKVSRARGDGALLAVPELAEHAVLVDRSPAVALGEHASVESYLEGLSRNRRKGLKRRRRRLGERGSLGLIEVIEPSDRRAAVAEALAFKRAWLAANSVFSATLSRADFGDRLSACAGAPELFDALKLFRLELDGKTLAVELGFIDGDAYRSYLGAFHPDWAKEGVGTVLTLEVIGWCIATGLRTYDLLPPDTDFKRSWADEISDVHEIIVPLSARGRAATPVLREGRRWAKARVAQLPAAARQLLG